VENAKCFGQKKFVRVARMGDTFAKLEEPFRPTLKGLVM
jgi:hypothetical protein